MTWLAETAMLAHGGKRFLMLVLAGAVAGLSVPPLFVLPALFLAFPVWVWALDGAERGKGARWLPGFSIGFAFGWGYFLVAFHWLGAAFFIDGGWLLGAMPFAIAALAALIALFWGLAGALAHRFWSHGPARVLLLASAVTLAEWLRGHVLSGFPFDLLGYALTGTDEMMQAAALVGVYGLTFLAALIGMTPALIWPADGRGLTRRLVPFFACLAVLAAQLGYGHVRLGATPAVPRTDMAMRLVQPLVTEHADWGNVDPIAIVERLAALSDMRLHPRDPGLAGATHLIWPESALPFLLTLNAEALARIARLLPEDTVLLAGAPRLPFGAGMGDMPFNALLAIDAEGAVIASYDKAHLVPFGEFLPFAELWGRLGIRQFVPGAAGWAHGDDRARLMAPAGTPAFLALICYEILFSGDLGDTGNAQYLLNITNDSWFDGSIGPAQHAHHARLRAVEEGMSLVRAANSGLTFLADPLGRITAQLPPGELGVLDVVPHERLVPTPFAQMRHWPLLGALAFGLAFGIGAGLRGRKGKGAPGWGGAGE